MSRNGISIMIILYFLLIAVLLFTSCEEDSLSSKPSSGSLVIEMTDGPADYTEVNVDIQEVHVHYAQDAAGSARWVALNTNSGVYNLLDFRNNVTTIIADSSFLSTGALDEIRLILGPQNSIVTDSVKYPLMIPSGASSGIKIKVHADVIQDLLTNVLIDFDARLSVHETGNGKYILSPVVKSERVHYKNRN